MITLVVKKGGEIFGTFNLARDKIVIGSHAQSDIVLSLQGVSANHASIELREGTYLLQDLSALGTTLNGEKVSQRPLSLGDQIGIAPFTIEVRSIVQASPDAISSTGIRRPQRWDEPFGTDMSAADVERVLSVKPFVDIDQSKFPPSTPLRDILRNDTRIVVFKDGDIIAREGDYTNTAYFIMSGSVRVVLDKLPGALLGRKIPKRKSVFGALAQLWSNPSQPEARDVKRYQLDARIGQRSEKSVGQAQRIFVQDVSAIIAANETVKLNAGEFFGEISALGRTPRTATVIAEGVVELLEIRWQGLRDIRKSAAQIKEHIDKIYRERSLAIHLKETSMFRHLTDEQLKHVSDQTFFETYGNFDWYASYKQLAQRSAITRLENEPVIAKEGDYPNGLLMIRSGFARVSIRHNHGHRTVRYLGRGDTFGFEELSHNWRSPDQVPFQFTLRAVGYVDVLLVPTPLIEQYVFPSIAPNKLPELIVRSKVADEVDAEAAKQLDPGLLEFLVENRYMNGSATMMIDLDRCTRCDDCVRACAATHDNNPRFLRHGQQYGNFMIANACMHCADPVCMIGCPTGAIHRDASGGQVVINDVTCIGCSMCANSCPYDNIRMVNIRDLEGVPVLSAESKEPIVKATKCDLCAEQITGPACQRACPHDAMRRVNMRDLNSLKIWTER